MNERAITEAAVKRAIEIVNAVELEGDMRVNMTTVIGAGRVLAKALQAHIAAQRSAEEDGAKPIDQEFLQTLGFVQEHHDCGDGYATFCTSGELSIWKSASGRWVMKDAAWIELITRAQLTALLVALNTKGTA